MDAALDEEYTECFRTLARSRMGRFNNMLQKARPYVTALLYGLTIPIMKARVQRDVARAHIIVRVIARVFAKYLADHSWLGIAHSGTFYDFHDYVRRLSWPRCAYAVRPKPS